MGQGRKDKMGWRKSLEGRHNLCSLPGKECNAIGNSMGSLLIIIRTIVIAYKFDEI
jgi:hypothetical protein